MVQCSSDVQQRLANQGLIKHPFREAGIMGEVPSEPACSDQERGEAENFLMCQSGSLAIVGSPPQPSRANSSSGAGVELCFARPTQLQPFRLAVPRAHWKPRCCSAAQSDQNGMTQRMVHRLPLGSQWRSTCPSVIQSKRHDMRCLFTGSDKALLCVSKVGLAFVMRCSFS